MEYDVIQRKKKENYYHLFSNSHQAAAEANELKLKWENLDMKFDHESIEILCPEYLCSSFKLI